MFASSDALWPKSGRPLASFPAVMLPLGVEKFGQTGNLPDLYAAYRLDGDAITEGIAELLLPQTPS